MGRGKRSKIRKIGLYMWKFYKMNFKYTIPIIWFLGFRMKSNLQFFRREFYRNGERKRKRKKRNIHLCVICYGSFNRIKKKLIDIGITKHSFVFQILRNENFFFTFFPFGVLLVVASMPLNDASTPQKEDVFFCLWFPVSFNDFAFSWRFKNS